MGKYTEDGGVVSSKTPVGEREDASDHRSMFGIYRGQIVQSVFPDEPNSNGKSRMEYMLRVRGQEYPNAIDMRPSAGGIYNYQERIRKGIEKGVNGETDEHEFPENLDGEMVFVMFIGGNGDVPIIVGGDTHPQHAAYTNPAKADGIFDVEEFNGVEFLIDKDSNMSITQLGRKDKDGKILNVPGVGASFTLYGNGDIELTSYPELKDDGSDNPDKDELKIFLTKATKIMKLFAQKNIVTMDDKGILIVDKNTNTATLDANGVKVVDKNTNTATLDASGVKIVDKNANSATLDASGIEVDDKNGNKVSMTSGGVTITASGPCTVKSSGPTHVDAGGPITLKASGNSINGGVVTDNSANNDPITGIPLTPVGGITTS